MRQAKVLRCISSLSLLVPFPPFPPHCSKTIAPCDPLFTIWTERESIHGEHCSSSHYSDRPTSLTHTFVMPKGRETNSKVSIKVSKVSIKSTLTEKNNNWLISNENNPNINSFLFSGLWFDFLSSLQAGSFRLWLPPGKQNGCYLSHSALWVAGSAYVQRRTAPHALMRIHIVPVKETPWKPWTLTFLYILSTSIDYNGQWQRKRTELWTTMNTRNDELFSLCGNDHFIGTLTEGFC